MSGVDVIDRIERIEEQVKGLKSSVRDKDVSMKGRLKDADFDERDFEEAENSLFEASWD